MHMRRQWIPGPFFLPAHSPARVKKRGYHIDISEAANCKLNGGRGVQPGCHVFYMQVLALITTQKELLFDIIM